MEHAGIVVQYGPKVPTSQVDSLISDVTSNYQWTVLAPYSKLGNKIAFEYWGHLTTCTSYQKPVLTDLQTHRNKPGWSQEVKLPGFN